MNRSARVILGALALAVVVYLYHALHSNHSSPPRDANLTFAAPAAQASASGNQNESQAKPPAASVSASVTAPKGKPAVSTGSQPVPGGLVAVIDPDTGQLRQADATDIGAAAATPAPLQRRALTLAAPTATEPETFTTPDGTVGAKLGDDSMSFMVVTKTPDGRLATECIDGKKAAEARVKISKGARNQKNKTATENNTKPAKQEAADEM